MRTSLPLVAGITGGAPLSADGGHVARADAGAVYWLPHGRSTRRRSDFEDLRVQRR